MIILVKCLHTNCEVEIALCLELTIKTLYQIGTMFTRWEIPVQSYADRHCVLVSFLLTLSRFLLVG